MSRTLDFFFYIGSTYTYLALNRAEDVAQKGSDPIFSESVTSIKDSGFGAKSWKGLDPGVFLGLAGKYNAFFVVHWRLDPFALLPGHCHPKTSVCTL